MEEEQRDESLGQYLSRTREQKGIDLKNIAVSTRINYKILYSLENDTFENLPNRAYLRGFVRCIAREIEADEEYALRLLDQYLKSAPEPSIEKKEYVAKPTRPRNRINSVLDKDLTKLENLTSRPPKISPKQLSFALLGIVILGTGIFYVRKIFIATNQEADMARKVEVEKPPIKKLPPSPPVQAEKDRERDIEKNIEDGDKKREKVALKVESKKEKIAKTELKENDTPPPPPVVKANLPRRTIQTSIGPVRLTKMQYPLYALYPEHPTLKDPDIFPQKVRAAYLPDKENIFINATRGDSWIIYKNTDARSRGFVLKQGRTLLIRGKEIRLFLGNLGAVDIFYNNQYLKASSSNGVRSLIFPHELAKKSEIPFFIYDKERSKYFTAQELEQEAQADLP